MSFYAVPGSRVLVVVSKNENAEQVARWLGTNACLPGDPIPAGARFDRLIIGTGFPRSGNMLLWLFSLKANMDKVTPEFVSIVL